MSEYLGSLAAGIVKAPKESNIMIIGSGLCSGVVGLLRAVAFRCPTTQSLEEINDDNIRKVIDQARRAKGFFSRRKTSPTDTLDVEFTSGECFDCPLFVKLVEKLVYLKKHEEIL